MGIERLSILEFREHGYLEEIDISPVKTKCVDGA
jgi:hypothetical protein